MTPKLISSSLIGQKVLLAFLGIILFVIFFIRIFTNGFQGSAIAIFLLGLIISVAGFYLLAISREVTFDQQFMYINKGRKSLQVPLTQIDTLKLTMTTVGDGRFVWKIKYTDENGKQSAILILPNKWQNHFEEFRQMVEERNPSVLIIRRSHSFDFDQ